MTSNKQLKYIIMRQRIIYMVSKGTEVFNHLSDQLCKQ